MEMTLSDPELVRRIGAGEDSEAESELCGRMLGRVRLYGLRHLRDETAAEDLAQQVLWIVIEALRAGRLEEPAKLSSFVFGTARLTLLDQRRSARRKQELLEAYPLDVPIPARAPEPRPDDTGLARCVQSLKEREKSVVMLSFYEEQPGEQLAGLLGLTEANVRVIRHRAILQLRQCMGVAA
jgi:RNA polymerase sigma-70 factor (ECF subfamily)